MDRIKKPFIIMLTLLLILCFVECDSNDSANNPLIDNLRLEGSWNLYKSYGGFSQPMIYDEGTLSLTFYHGNTLSVSSDNKDHTPFLPIGEYTYFCQQKTNTIVINKVSYQFFIEDKTLTIHEDLTADGKAFVFKLKN
ncbi:MAG: hypothetical protein IJK42_05320 [Prevotella sp.]|nr:hypothetical protein [Prevotella sp.]MBQ6209174.1 hypothetical protein [Prevotella sp.]